jgi:hypothetical protein
MPLLKTTPLFTSLRIKSIQHLVYQHKLSFVNQLNNIDLTKQIYEYLNKFEKAPTDSFFKSIKKIRENLDLAGTVNSKKKIDEMLYQFFRFKHDEHGLVDTLKTILRKFYKYDDNIKSQMVKYCKRKQLL